MNKYFQMKTFSSLTVQEQQQQEQQLSNIKDCLRKLAVKNHSYNQFSPNKKCPDYPFIPSYMIITDTRVSMQVRQNH